MLEKFVDCLGVSLWPLATFAMLVLGFINDINPHERRVVAHNAPPAPFLLLHTVTDGRVEPIIVNVNYVKKITKFPERGIDTAIIHMKDEDKEIWVCESVRDIPEILSGRLHVVFDDAPQD